MHSLRWLHLLAHLFISIITTAYQSYAYCICSFHLFINIVYRSILCIDCVRFVQIHQKHCISIPRCTIVHKTVLMLSYAQWCRVWPSFLWGLKLKWGPSQDHYLIQALRSVGSKCNEKILKQKYPVHHRKPPFQAQKAPVYCCSAPDKSLMKYGVLVSHAASAHAHGHPGYVMN